MEYTYVVHVNCNICNSEDWQDKPMITARSLIPSLDQSN